MKRASYRSIRDRLLSLLHAVRSPSLNPGDSDNAPTPATEGSELIATVPGRIVFAVGGQTAIEVTCPYCESVHQHLMSADGGGMAGRKTGRGRVRGIVFDAPCGWGKYRVESDTGELS